MINFNTLLLLLTFNIVLGACSAPGVKPKDANLFEAIGNSGHGGEFDRQLERKHLDLKISRDNLSNEQSRQHTLRSELRKSQAEKQRLDKELANLTRDNNNLSRSIRMQKARTQVQINNKIRLNTKVTSINSEIHRIKRKRKEDSISEYNYKAEIEQLQREVAALKKIILNQ